MPRWSPQRASTVAVTKFETCPRQPVEQVELSGVQFWNGQSTNHYSLLIGEAGNFMIKRMFLLGVLMAVTSTLTCTSVAVEPSDTNSSATDPTVRMKSWEHHVKLRQESIFKDVAWIPVGREYRAVRSRAFGL